MTTYEAFLCYMTRVRAAWKRHERPPNFPAKLLDELETMVLDWSEERGRKLLLEGIEDEKQEER